MHTRIPRSTAIVCLLLIAGGLLAGCSGGCTASLTTTGSMAKHEALVKLAITIGTDKFLQAHPRLVATVYTIAHNGQQTLKETIDLTQLRSLISAEIAKTSVSLDDQILLGALADAALEEAQAYVTAAELKPTDIQLFAARVCGWMADAALLRLGGKVPA